jgi:hypothetical protein
MPVKVACVLLFLAACLLLCWGGATLLLIPQGDIGEGYFAVWRMLYGGGPTLAAVILLLIVGWL